MLGSEFLDDFMSLVDLCKQKQVNELEYLHFLANNPREEVLEKYGFYIQDLSIMFSSNMIFGDIDGHGKNIGVVRHPIEPGVFLAAKVDHELALRNLGEDGNIKSVYLNIHGVYRAKPETPDYTLINDNELAKGFEVIANLPVEVVKKTLLSRI